MSGRAKRLLLAPMALVLLLVAAAPASAEAVTKAGDCSLGWATYTVEFKNDFGPTLEISAFVDATEANRVWRVNMRHNGTLFLSELVTTNSHGNFQIEAHHPAKHLLPDAVVFKAFNRVTGEVCVAQATLK